MTDIMLEGIYTRVVAPDGSVIHPSKTFVVDGRLIVVRAVNRQVEVVYSAAVTSFNRSVSPRRIPHTVLTDLGEFSITEAGCGCGSPLKSFSWRKALALTEVKT